MKFLPQNFWQYYRILLPSAQLYRQAPLPTLSGPSYSKISHTHLLLLGQSKYDILKDVLSLLWVDRLPEGVVLEEGADTPPSDLRVYLLVVLHDTPKLLTVPLGLFTLLFL